MSKRASFHHGDLRATLIQAALVSVEECGVDRLSLRDLAEKAFVARSAPYRHFASRLELLGELARIAHGDFLQAYSDIADSAPAETRLRRMGLAYLDMGRRRPQLFQLLFADDALWEREGGTRPAFKPRAFDLFEEVVGAIMVGQDTSAIRSMALACWSTLHGYTMLCITGRLAGFPVDLPLEDFILDMVHSMPTLVQQ